MRSLIVLMGLMAMTHAQADIRTLARPKPMQAQTALQLINQARQTGYHCGNTYFPPARPLTWNDALTRSSQKYATFMAQNNQFGHAQDGKTAQQRNEEDGYQGLGGYENLSAGRHDLSQVIEHFLKSEEHCRNIMQADLTDMGMAYAYNPKSTYQTYWVQNFGNRHINTRRSLTERPDAQKMLQAVNQLRSRPRQCGKQAFASAPPLRWNEQLAQSAQIQAQDMAKHNHVQHKGANGSDLRQRLRQTGYKFQSGAENISAGQFSLDDVLHAWLKSAGHCANLMNPHMHELGMAYAENPKTEYRVYWVQVFGSAFE